MPGGRAWHARPPGISRQGASSPATVASGELAHRSPHTVALLLRPRRSLVHPPQLARGVQPGELRVAGGSLVVGADVRRQRIEVLLARLPRARRALRNLPVESGP